MATLHAARPTSISQKSFALHSALKRSFAINTPLTLVGLVMLATLFATLIGLIIDHRVLTGVPAWIKPAKFAISMAFYSFTLLWMLGFIKGRARIVQPIAHTVALGFLVEIVIIVTQVVRGTTSHFNFTTFMNAFLYTVMGSFITVVWVATLIAAILLLVQRMPNPVFAWSLRLGILLSLVGMAVGIIMTLPTTTQLAALHASGQLPYIGAHSVGATDSGPGLPFLGWSTVGGDLRIAHFVGLHALQVIPLVGWLLILSRVSILTNGHKLALLWTFGMGYLGLIVLLTWQALRAQSLIAPDALTLEVFALLLAAIALVIIAIVTHARLRVVA